MTGEEKLNDQSRRLQLLSNQYYDLIIFYMGKRTVPINLKDLLLKARKITSKFQLGRMYKTDV